MSLTELRYSLRKRLAKLGHDPLSLVVKKDEITMNGIKVWDGFDRVKELHTDHTCYCNVPAWMEISKYIADKISERIICTLYMKLRTRTKLYENPILPRK